MSSLMRMALSAAPVPKLPYDPSLVVLITGEPSYIQNPELAPMVEEFYNDIVMMLGEKGFRVQFDYGHPYTFPDRTARIWVAHDRGVYRRRHLSPHTIFIPLETQSSYGTYASEHARRRCKNHYMLSERDRIVLDALACES